MSTFDLPIRPRRNRQSEAIRGLIRETRLSAGQLIYPLFVHEDSDDTALESLPGQTRWGHDGLVAEAKRAYGLGIRAVVLFPKVPEAKKNPTGDESWNPDGLIPQTIRRLKESVPELAVITDVALDPYNSDGHDGIVSEGIILNDETVEVLCKQAVCQAQAGADIVAPSDMMDGRVGEIRDALDAEGFEKVAILSYTAKYASAFYGPFRGALDSAPKSGDKKTYQMDPANSREALREAALDEGEGADMLMVKPAGPYLDVISLLAESTDLPIAAYQVSGEYLMIKAAAASGWLDEKAAVMESLIGIRRAGADMILTYFAPQAAQWLSE
ncbi:MAG: porphobilinogen synthase [Planctomycetes bacterium]|nr:porphobilinogen synthase [Planctomycetota bacterium]